MKKLFLLALIAAAAFTACKKEDTASTDDTDELVNDQATLDNLVADDDLLFEEVLYGVESRIFPAAACLTITHDTTVTPRLITLDYGTVNCRCRDGRFRRGIVQISYTGRPNQPGSEIIVTFSNYFVNDHQIAGSRTMNNTTYPGTGNPARVRSANITVTFPRGATMTRTEADTVEFFQGSATLNDRTDDVYLIRGSASGSRPGGGSYSRVINSPLRREATCRWLTSGNMTITVGIRPARTIDYGNGSCDNQATVTVNGTTRTITLP